jgi:hypothetical protein
VYVSPKAMGIPKAAASNYIDFAEFTHVTLSQASANATQQRQLGMHDRMTWQE